MTLNKLRRQMRDESGQGMTEYIIIVALIAIAAIGVVTVFGDNVRHIFGLAVDALAGEASEANTSTHSGTADRRNITDYTQHSDGSY